MKTVFLVLVLCLATVPLMAFQSVVAGPYSGSAAVDRGTRGVITSVEIRGDGTNPCTCEIRSGGDDTGSVLWPSTTINGGDRLIGHEFNSPVPYSNGFYVKVSTCTGGSCTVYRDTSQ